MATFTHTWTFPANQASRFQDGAAYGWGYKDTIKRPDGSVVNNPESKTDFIHRKLTQLAIDLIKTYEAQRDQDTARNSALASVDGIGITGS